MFEILLVVFGIAGIGAFLTGMKKFRDKRMIENIPTSKVRSVAMGLAELKGKAAIDQAGVIISPITSSQCVFFKFLVEEYRKRGKNSHWVTLASGASWEKPFFIEDETGKILVDPRGADLIMDPSYKYSSGLTALPGNLVSFLTTYNVNRGGFLMRRSLRFTEWVICPGDPVYVLGDVSRKTDLAEEMKNSLTTELANLKNSADFMKVADENEDGVIEPEEWDTVVKKVRESLLEKTLSTGIDISDGIVVSKAKEERIFVISNKSEKDIVKTMTVTSLALIIIGALITLVAVIQVYIKYL